MSSSTAQQIFPNIKGTIGSYVNLTKPGILILLLISTACPMILAAGGEFHLGIFIYTMLGGALVASSASTFNCILDRDIDAIMERTKQRSLPAGRVSVFAATIFSLAIGFLGLAIFYFILNPLSAAIALFGHLFYVVIYTVWLKRTTPQNIVIGGAAGAVPPMVAWAAVTGEVNLTAFLLFLIIFLWTPPHFWALALNKNEDYKRAKVPMLPLVVGSKQTSVQMLIYALSLIPVSIVLVYSDNYLGQFSLFSLVALGVIFAYRNFRLLSLIKNDADKELQTSQAWSVFRFSLVYLALFFACIVVDSTII